MEELQKKMKQLLKIESIKTMYDTLIALPSNKNFDPAFMVKEIIIRFGEGAECRELEQKYEDAINAPYIQKLDQFLANEEKFRRNIKEIPDSEWQEVFSRLDYLELKLSQDINQVIEEIFTTALQMHKEGRLKVTWPGGMAAEALSEYISIANSQLYYNFRVKLAAGNFNGDTWPETDISGSQVKGRALLKPENISPVAKEETLLELQKTMMNKVMDLTQNGDLAVDILDIVIAKHIRTSNNFYQPIRITADDFLEARGIKKILGGSGRRGGYKEAWRQEIAKYLYTLSDVFLEVAEMEVYEYNNKGIRQKVNKKNLHSRAVVLSSMETQGKLDDKGPEILAWYVRPGDCFIPALTDPGYQTALLSQKALQYDYNKYKYEKRLTRFLHYMARMKNPKERLRVKTLLSEIRLEIKDKRPGRTKDRLEAALNRLKEDEVIAAWEYENKTPANKKDWLKKWLESIVIINMPEYLLEHYKQIKRPEGKK